MQAKLFRKADEKAFFGHPRALLFILLCQSGFAFSISGMQAIGVLYLSTYLFQPDHIGEIIGFDETHEPNHLNIILGVTARATGPQLQIALGSRLKFVRK